MHAKSGLFMPCALACSAAVLLWLGQATDIDLDIATLSYDAASGRFPLRDAWFTSQFFHGYMKLFVVTIGVAFLTCALVDYWRPGKYWTRQTGWRIRTVALCAILVPTTISMLKQMSRTHCPWDIALFGGVEPYVRLLDRIPAGASPGQCFPAGHASGGLWLASIMLFWLPGKPHIAWGVGGSLLCVGIAMGIVQQVRGAHFMTHTLWSAWIAISLMYAAYGTLRLVENRHLLNTGQI
ncbi:phosphatase PAP2 family protein [Massilia sp. CF038]|uniref:phosphatase PAP2 family protein n=1 Tax=Massilia sp. CF038 TaxID=1881045 RepID=UPI00091919F4|nr:phosphatase PAP2 family protein [Massilia sp. CF038]SHG76125.1 Membrane-associated enzyme, PAP2 (acid phosphatase) superfamily [Massilia sp. CF038]